MTIIQDLTTASLFELQAMIIEERILPCESPEELARLQALDVEELRAIVLDWVLGEDDGLFTLSALMGG